MGIQNIPESNSDTDNDDLDDPSDVYFQVGKNNTNDLPNFMAGEDDPEKRPKHNKPSERFLQTFQYDSDS